MRSFMISSSLGEQLPREAAFLRDIVEGAQKALDDRLPALDDDPSPFDPDGDGVSGTDTRAWRGRCEFGTSSRQPWSERLDSGRALQHCPLEFQRCKTVVRRTTESRLPLLWLGRPLTGMPISFSSITTKIASTAVRRGEVGDAAARDPTPLDGLRGAIAVG